MAPDRQHCLVPGLSQPHERFTRPLRVQNALAGIDLVDGKQAVEVFEQELKNTSERRGPVKQSIETSLDLEAL